MGPGQEISIEMGPRIGPHDVQERNETMSYYSGKVAVVTGAGSGIGRALARQLSAEGCHLAISDINEASLAETVDGLPGKKLVKVVAGKLDVADRGVHVTCVHPGVIATNIAVAAGAPEDMQEFFAQKGMSPEKAAKKLLRGVERGKARVRITQEAYMLDFLQCSLRATENCSCA
jgi:short-subunit dehydrogenase